MSGIAISDLDFARFSDQVRRPGTTSTEGSALETREAPGVTREQLGEVARAFEQMLLGMMVESMRQALPEGGLMPEAPGHDLYEQMMYQEVVRSSGQGDGMDLGLREAIERHFEAFVVDEEPVAESEDSAPPESTPADNAEERRVAGS